METIALTIFKDALREIIRNSGRIPDQESFDLVQQVVPWPATEVCLVNHQGELLLHRREFSEWKGAFGEIHDWYIPGGYMKTHGSIEDWCRHHLSKDGVSASFDFLGEFAGVLKWASGEHPVGFPLSINCVCRLKGKVAFRSGTENDFMFVDKTVPTAVPNHTRLQELFFRWRDQNLHLFNRSLPASSLSSR